MRKVSVVLVVLLSVLTPRGVQCQNFGFRSPLLRSGFPGMLGQFSNNPYSQFGNLGNYQQQQQQRDDGDELTCIHSNPQDPNSLIRLTITRQHMSGPVSPLLLYGGARSSDVPLDWQIDGYFKPSSLSAVAGPLQVVVTQYGRVHDGCNAAALGPAVVSSFTTTTPFSSAAATFPLLLLNPFSPSQQASRPAGHLHNPLYLTPGGVTVYSARLRGISRSQLLGGGVGVCPRVSGSGECMGAVLQCCSIVKDQLPASKVYLNPAQPNLGVVGSVGSTLPFPGASFGFQQFGGVSSSIPFAINSDDFLAFSDPNAAVAAGALAANSDTSAREQSSAESEAPVDSSSSSSSPSSSSTSPSSSSSSSSSSSEEGFF